MNRIFSSNSRQIGEPTRAARGVRESAHERLLGRWRQRNNKKRQQRQKCSPVSSIEFPEKQVALDNSDSLSSIGHQPCITDPPCYTSPDSSYTKDDFEADMVEIMEELARNRDTIDTPTKDNDFQSDMAEMLNEFARSSPINRSRMSSKSSKEDFNVEDFEADMAEIFEELARTRVKPVNGIATAA